MEIRIVSKFFLSKFILYFKCFFLSENINLRNPRLIPGVTVNFHRPYPFRNESVRWHRAIFSELRRVLRRLANRNVWLRIKTRKHGYTHSMSAETSLLRVDLSARRTWKTTQKTSVQRGRALDTFRGSRNGNKMIVKRNVLRAAQAAVRRPIIHKVLFFFN